MRPSSNSAKENARHLSGVILAGGKSTRFGKDKSRLEISGKRVIDHLVEILGAFPFQSLAIVTAQGKGRDWPKDVPALFDDQEGLGPLGGIATALRHLAAGILVTACDMPCLSVPTVEWLLSHYDEAADAVVPRHPNGIEPLFSIYTRSFLPTIEQAIRDRHYALHSILAQARVRFADVPDHFSPEREFANINTHKDYERVSKLIRKTDG